MTHAANDNTVAPTATIHLGDCLDVMLTMADGAVDLVVTSPPYNLQTGAGVHWPKNTGTLNMSNGRSRCLESAGG
jgi:DNA modification methylase